MKNNTNNRNIFFYQVFDFIYIYLSNKSFAACLPGYFGQFCNESCPQGRFGDKCDSRCYPKCTEIYCHHVAGCQNTNVTTTGRTLPGKHCTIQVMKICIAKYCWCKIICTCVHVKSLAICTCQTDTLFHFVKKMILFRGRAST